MSSKKHEIHNHMLQAAVKKYPKIHDIFSQLGPIWFPYKKHPDLLSFVSRAIIGQQLSVMAARSIWQKLLLLSHKESIPLDTLLSSKYEEGLRACGISSNKIKGIISVSDGIRSEKINDSILRKHNHTSRSEILTQIWGVGQWTADMVSIFYYKDIDVWPLSDVSANRALNEIVRSDKKAKSHLMISQEVPTHFAPYRSLLALYMWKIVDLKICK